jgi:prepilin-type N-terminal cleavage/methylation domain-containing protein
MRKQAAFTLIELLVVVAIIAILAAVLFPILARVRENARQAQCSTNLKQIGMAVQLYLGDWDDDYPFTINPGWSDTQNNPLTPYIHNMNRGRSSSEEHLDLSQRSGVIFERTGLRQDHFRQFG